MLSRAVVQSGGHAYRMSGTMIRQEFMRGGAVQRLLLRYTQVLLSKWRRRPFAIGITRWATTRRWLLLSLDRLASNHVLMTQELIANIVECAAKA